MKLEQARLLADKWVDNLRPYCTRIEIAGGVRRQKAEPHDIEIVCVPRTDVEKDMFGYVIGDENRLEFFIDGLAYLDEFKKIKDGKKFKQLALPEGINIDLFIVRPETWAVQFVIRTGPADFSHWIVTQRKYGGALPSNCRVKDGQVWKDKAAMVFDEEIDFLNFLGLGWVEPKDRRPGLPIIDTVWAGYEDAIAKGI